MCPGVAHKQTNKEKPKKRKYMFNKFFLLCIPADSQGYSHCCVLGLLPILLGSGGGGDGEDGEELRGSGN